MSYLVDMNVAMRDKVSVHVIENKKEMNMYVKREKEIERKKGRDVHKRLHRFD